MTLDELQALAHAVEPIPLDKVHQAHHEWARAHNGAVGRFHQRVIQARDTLTGGRPVEPGLVEELRVLGRTLPRVRKQVAP